VILDVDASLVEILSGNKDGTAAHFEGASALRLSVRPSRRRIWERVRLVGRRLAIRPVRLPVRRIGCIYR